MSGWDILNELMKGVPPIAGLMLFLAFGVIFAVGFSRHGLSFVKYGFKQTVLDNSLDKRFDAIDKRFDTSERRFDDFGKRFDDFGKRFDVLEKRFDTSERRFDDFGKRFDVLEKRFDTSERRFDDFEKRFDKLEVRIDGIQVEFKAELDTIKSNHFGHLKNFLTELTSILVDKGIIDNQNKAQLDNKLSGM